ncbi:MAG: RNA polymerase sigma-70 factor [Bacteroidota bacterium]
MITSEEEKLLWDRLKRRDEGALKKFFFFFHKKLTSRAYHLVNDQQKAEELVQDLFLSIWEKAPSIEMEGRIENYLMVAIRNRCFNYLKSKYAKQQFTDLKETHAEVVMQPNAHDFEELSHTIDLAIKKLPNRCKEIFLLSRRHELSYQEIADRLQISKKTVETQMGIALKKLRELIKVNQ